MPFDPADQELRLIALEKVERVIALLDDRERWCKGALRTDDGRMCILGAVRAANAELVLYARILRAIREVTGNAYRHIETFNDSWLTSHALVLDVLDHVRAELELGVVAQKPQPVPRHERPERPESPVRQLARFASHLRARIRAI